MDGKFRTEITAERTQYDAVMDGALGKAKLTSQGMAEAFMKFQNTLIGVGAAIAGGGIFGKAVNESKELVVESQKLGRALGISATEASILAVALGDIHQNADVMLGANRAMTRSLRENEEAFKSLGVETRTGNGEFRNSLDIMLDVNKRLLEFKEGTDRNIEGQKIYKKSWEEVSPVLKLTADVMEKAKQKAEALGLVVGTENIAAVTQYRAAMNDVGDVMKAVGKAIGDAVMPVLTEMGEWFSETGPERVAIMRGAMAVLVAAFYSLKTVLQVVWEVIKAFVQTGVVALLKFAETAEKAIRFDFSGAKATWGRGTDQQEAIWRAAGERIKTIAEENGRKTADAFERGFGKPVVTPTVSQGGAGSAGGEDKGRVQRWEADLAEMRDGYDRMMLEQGSFEQLSKERESAYWKDILDTEKLSEEERVAVSKKYYDLEREIRKRAIKEQQALGALSIEEGRAQQLQGLELERNDLETMEKLGQITAKQKFERLRELNRMEYEENLRALQAKLELLQKLDPENKEKYAEQLKAIEDLKRKHAVDMNKIDNQMLVESVRVWNQIGEAITGAFSTAMKGVIMGTQTLTQAVRNMGQSVLLSLIDMYVKAAAEALKNAIIGKAISKTQGVSEITTNAAVGATAAAASVAAIPYYGWAMAPEVAAEHYAASLAFMGAMGARGGFDIPTGVNPITQLHQEEMVLPADIANPLRESLARDGAAGGGDTYHLTIKAWDGKSVMDNRRAIVAAIRAAERDFGYNPKRR